MTEARATTTLSLLALLAALAAWATRPYVPVVEMLAERGQPFFPQFADASDARSLEVIEFDSENGQPRALKLLNRDGRWTIPSQFDYPAEAASRVGDVAAMLSTARKDDVAGDAPAEHKRFGVLDPSDVAAGGVKGKGTRIVIRGENDRVLADLIVGGNAEGGDYRYVRIPRQNRVYLTRMDGFEISAAFEHWIDRDVLQVKPDDIDEIVIRNYSVDERSGAVNPRETNRLRRQEDGRWRFQDAQGAAPANRPRVNALLEQLVELRIVGALPKPAGITSMLNRTAAQQRVSESDVRDLARKGFYIAGSGELFSNEGEVIVHTRSGIFYTLRFGQVAEGVDTPATSGGDAARSAAEGEHRYLFVTAAYDPTTAAAGGASPQDAQQRVNVLHARFAPWYYIISASNFSRLRPGRAELVNE